MPEDRALDLALMKQVCVIFIGEHDFYSFASRDKNSHSTVRTITKLSLKKTESLDMDLDVFFFEVEGDGFLRHMIRYMVSSIIEVGRGRIDTEDIRQALHNRNEDKLTPKAKARGLHLLEVNYE